MATVCSRGGLIVGFWLGFLEVLKHVILRFLLWLTQTAPRDYAKFLAYASELRLVQNLGGRYRFVHDLLREHLIAGHPLPRRGKISPFVTLIGLPIAALVSLSVSSNTIPVPSFMAEVITPSLKAGEVIFYDPYSYRFIAPRRRELIRYEEEDVPWIMWTVGLPGEEIASREGRITINNQPLNDACLQLPDGYEIKPIQVPDDSYYVFNSFMYEDSFIPLGFVVKRQQINGRFIWRFWPLNRFGAIDCD